MNVKHPERRYGFKRLREMRTPEGDVKLIGPLMAYDAYSLPVNGRLGLWSDPRVPKFAKSGWHFYRDIRTARAKAQRGRGLVQRRYRWFLIEAEAPFSHASGVTAARRIRFIADVTPSAGEPLPSLSRAVRDARKKGLV